ncbi:DUF3147 family protein [Bacillus massiliigorillae]|uniref:DUF3147 family protein n=1 Tax=Bacillus massiliigorillae TaxID=1243664 RepID=UPI0003A5FCC2|nr:DUF3147 family protein [Bacillus massiliigorillae]
MVELSLSALLIRFLLGGSAVVLCTIVGKKLGERAGGIFAAFPAVYLAALLTAAFDFDGEALINHSIVLSKGALIGMAINIVIAIIAGQLLVKQGWKKGLTSAMMCWAVFSATVVIITSQL